MDPIICWLEPSRVFLSSQFFSFTLFGLTKPPLLPQTAPLHRESFRRAARTGTRASPSARGRQGARCSEGAPPVLLDLLLPEGASQRDGASTTPCWGRPAGTTELTTPGMVLGQKGAHQQPPTCLEMPLGMSPSLAAPCRAPVAGQ